MSFKRQVHEICCKTLQSKMEVIKEEFRSIAKSVGEETKSSMGDKYETSREMMQQERNKLATQLEVITRELTTLNQIDPEKYQDAIMKGSLVQTDKAWFYVSIALGQLRVENKMVFVLSENAPLAKVMIGKKKSEEFSFNNQKHEILSIN